MHLPALAITVVLLYLDFSATLYSQLGTSNQNLQFNALQFAAKIHEIAIVASLSSIAISIIQYEISGSKGLSLGGVLAGFQVIKLSSLLNSGF